MRITFALWFGLVALTALAQTTPPDQNANAIPVDASQITMPVFATNPVPATGATLGLVGNPGPRTDYYWIAANYVVGKSNLAGPFKISTAPNTRSSSNYVTVNPTLGLGAVSYDVLRTITPIAPTGTCTCAVATSVAIGTVTNDQSGTLSSYTVNPVNIATLNLTLQNEVQSSAVSHLILRQNGVLVCDLSVGCSGGSGVTGSGSSPIFPIWTGPTAIGNSNLSNVTSPNGIQYSLGGGLFWQLDSSHLTFNSGVSGSANVVIANTYQPTSGNNAGGIALQGAPATGSACAGSASLLGNATNSANNGASIVAQGGCSNGFGATGADVTISGGVTAASNTGGNIRLTPGTGGFGNGAIFLGGLTGCVAGNGSSSAATGTGSACPTTTAVTPGTYTNPTITLNNYGQVTAATNGSSPSPTPANPPQRVTLGGSVSISPTTQTTVLTETVTFPSAAGTYRADSRYGVFVTTGPNACVAEVIDTTNSHAFALSGQDSNGTGFIALSGSEVSSNTYAAGATATFTLQVICNNGSGGLVGATVTSGLFTLSPAEPSYLSVTPVFSN